jgi:Fe(3+) dicitrate transport protein
MKSDKRRAIASLAAISTLLPAVGAHADGDNSRSLETIDTITIIGRTTDVADVPGSAHVVSAEELAIFNATDILRVLRKVPGVYVQEEEGFGLRPNIGIRGSGLDRSARIALLEDGILIAPAPYSAPSAYYFPTQRRMNSLEVLKGPASVAIGPRTTGGAVNMISTPIPEAMGAMADLRIGQHNSADAHVNVGNRGQRLSWLLETVQAGSDGFKHIDGPVGGDTGYDLEDYVAKLQIDSDPQSQIYQSLRVKLGYTEQDANETYLGLTDGDFGVDPNLRYAASANDLLLTEHEQYQASYVIDPGHSWRAEVTAYRNDFWRNWYKVQSVGGTGISSVLEDPDSYAAELGYLKGATSPDDAVQIRANNRNYYSQGVQARLQWDTGFGDTEIALTTGVRIHEDEEDRFQHQDGYRMEDGTLVLTTDAAAGSQTNRVSQSDVRALFVDAEIRTGNWILTPGVRFEDIDMVRLDYSTSDPTRSQGPGGVRENSTQVVIPGMGVLYRVTPEWRLLAGLHKGFNPPAPGSSASEEESLNFEAGARYDGGDMSVEGIYFLNDYDNLVGTVTESTGGGGEIGDQFDGGEVRVSGIELSGGYRWQFGNVDLPVDLRDVQVGDELPYIPEHQLRAMAGLESDKWRFNIAASYIGKLRTRAGQGEFVPEESIDSHVVWDVVAAWQFTPQLSTYVKVDNLFDETYIAARRPAGVRPGLPRTAFLGLTYRL